MLVSNVPSKLCARVHIGHKTSGHNKTWSAHSCKCSFQKYILYAHTLSLYMYTSFIIEMSSGKMLHKRTFMDTLTLKKREYCLSRITLQLLLLNRSSLKSSRI